VETVRSLAAFLERRQSRSVEIVDSERFTRLWAPWRVRDVRREAVLDVLGVAWPRELTIPGLWFESCAIITVAEVAPSPTGRFSGVLDAQAAPLRAVQRRFVPGRALIAEAERLASSDLGVACGYADRRDQGSEVWWAISPVTVGVDRVVARAAGLDPARLPAILALRRHVALPETPEPREGELPRLVGCLSGVSRMAWTGLCDTIGGARAALTRDYRALRRNLPKIPGAVQRRLAGLKRQGRAA
jgi:hypothetical protein